MFQIRQRGSTVSREVVGGLTTFMAMSYIIFVQVAFLGQVGMNPRGVMMATCLASALACVMMGLLANYPIALAPGMGENTFFAFVLVATMSQWGVGEGWHMALALTALAGVIFLVLSLVSFRAKVLGAIPDSLKSGIAAGIGLFVAVIGLNNANLVRAGGALTTLPSMQNNVVAWVALTGLAITLALMALKVRGAILLGILGTAGVSLLVGGAQWHGLVDWPQGLGDTAGKVAPGLSALIQALPDHWADIAMLLFVLLFMDLFDTVGTLVGVSTRAGLMVQGKLPRAERALMADAAGTVGGALLGTSTVTSYIESVTGVESGARTGLAALVVAGCMGLAMFFWPVVEMVMGNYHVAGVAKYPTIAPALIVVGALMMRSIREVRWEDPTEYVPAFLTVVFIPLSYSIADGIALGVITYAAAKLLSGRPRECPALLYVFAVLMALRYALPVT